MSDDPTPPPSTQIVAALRARSEASWSTISDAVRDRVRATSRPGRRLLVAGSSSRIPGDLAVRDQALRALIARALRADSDYEPASVELRVSEHQLSGVRVTLRGTLDAELRVVAHRVRQIILAVVRDVLGEAQHNLLTHTIEVDVKQTGQHRERGAR